MRGSGSSINSKYGAAEAPDWDSIHLQFFFCQKRFCMSPLVGSQYGATIEAAESLLAQLDSQSKLATGTPRRKNLKIQHKIEF
jgi:hypothetical protein